MPVIIQEFMEKLLIPAYNSIPRDFLFILPYFLLFLINSSLIVLIFKKKINISLSKILIFALFLRLFYLCLRILTNQTIIDNDAQLFKDYGSSFLHGYYPAMEYPPGALLYFSLFSYIPMPILNLVFEIITIITLYKLNKIGSYIYALNPFLLPIWYGKYESLPVALTVLAIFFIIRKKFFLVGLFIGLGFATKWLPAVLLPGIFLWLLLQKKWRGLFSLSLSFTAIAILFNLPFYLWNKYAFIHTYLFQQQRTMMAESIYYLFQPVLQINQAPWTDINSSIFPKKITMLMQIIAVSLPLSILFLCKKTMKQCNNLTMVVFPMCLFILFNRVFSPQFVVFLLISYLILLKEPKLKWLLLINALPFLTFLIWPVFFTNWYWCSWLFFAINVALIAKFLLPEKQLIRQEN